MPGMNAFDLSNFSLRFQFCDILRPAHRTQSKISRVVWTYQNLLRDVIVPRLFRRPASNTEMGDQSAILVNRVQVVRTVLFTMLQNRAKLLGYLQGKLLCNYSRHVSGPDE